MAIAAMVLTMAGVMTSCGDEPEQGPFQIKVEALDKRVHIVVTAQDEEKEVLLFCPRKSIVDQKGGIQTYTENALRNLPYADMLETETVFKKQYDEVLTAVAGTEFIAAACYIEKDENGYVKMLSTVSSKEFTTMPEYALNGEFSISADKKVHFSQSNLETSSGQSYFFFDHQYDYHGSATEKPIDLFPWSTVGTFSTSAWFVPSADEWFYLFRQREHAANLFTFATITVNGKDYCGIILLPDNWQIPKGIHLLTPAEINIVWNEETLSYKYMPSTEYDGYSHNKYTKEEWEKLEFAGAVFLPAAGYGTFAGTDGFYWSSTASNAAETEARAFFFQPQAISFKYLKQYGYNAEDTHSIRPVREVK